MTLTIPYKRDPIARLLLFVMLAFVIYAALPSAPTPAAAQSEPIILIATPTLPVFLPTTEPIAVQAVATPTIQVVVEQPAPVIIEQPAPPIYIQDTPVVIVQEAPPVYVQDTPVVIVQTAVPEIHTELPSGAVIIETVAPVNPSDFVAPDPNAKCQFVGCL